MFEQSLYNQQHEPVPESHEGDLFNNYEIRNWNFTPRLYKILGASALLNILLILLIGQTSLLTMKGCDSPFVGRVCQVLDTVYVGSMLFGTDREYVDQAYEKTELANADITFVDVSDETPPLTYPEGYFALANPGQTFEQANDPLAGFNPTTIPAMPIPQSSGDLLKTNPTLPQTNPNAVQGELPTFNDNPTTINSGKKGHGGKINQTANANSKPETSAADGKPEVDANKAEPAPTPLSSDAVTALEINKKPLTDFADGIVAQWSANQIDLNQPFTVVLNGLITKDGKLDRDKSKFDVTKQKGDPKMIDVAKSALEAIGDSGFLTYLASLDIEKVTITLVQDDKQITAVISSTQKTPERAKTISSGLNGYISLGKMKFSDPGTDERKLLDGAQVTSDGRNFLLNFALPKPIAQEMITRRLKEAQAKKAQQQQPNGTAVTKPAQNSAK